MGGHGARSPAHPAAVPGSPVARRAVAAPARRGGGAQAVAAPVVLRPSSAVRAVPAVVGVVGVVGAHAVGAAACAWGRQEQGRRVCMGSPQAESAPAKLRPQHGPQGMHMRLAVRRGEAGHEGARGEERGERRVLCPGELRRARQRAHLPWLPPQAAAACACAQRLVCAAGARAPLVRAVRPPLPLHRARHSLLQPTALLASCC